MPKPKSDKLVMSKLLFLLVGSALAQHGEESMR